MITELVGLPGAGKTTWAKKLVEKCHAYTIVSIEGKDQLLYFSIISCIRHPIRALYLFWVIVHNSPTWKHFYMKFMNNFLYVSAKYEKARRIPYPIIDQGYIQNIISLFEEKVEDKRLLRYFKHVVPQQRIIIFDIERHTRDERLIERGYGVREGFDSDLRERWLEAIEFNFSNLKNILSRTAKDSLVWIKSEDDENKVITTLCQTR